MSQMSGCICMYLYIYVYTRIRCRARTVCSTSLCAGTHCSVTSATIPNMPNPTFVSRKAARSSTLSRLWCRAYLVSLKFRHAYTCHVFYYRAYAWQNWILTYLINISILCINFEINFGILAYVPMCVLVWMYQCVCWRGHVFLHACMFFIHAWHMTAGTCHDFVNKQTYPYMHACKHTYIHSHMNACMHTQQRSNSWYYLSTMVPFPGVTTFREITWLSTGGICGPWCVRMYVHEGHGVCVCACRTDCLYVYVRIYLYA